MYQDFMKNIIIAQLYNILGYLSKRGGKDGAFQGLAGILRGTGLHKIFVVLYSTKFKVQLSVIQSTYIIILQNAQQVCILPVY